jgi:hypothetical protein
LLKLRREGKNFRVTGLAPIRFGQNAEKYPLSPLPLPTAIEKKFRLAYPGTL